MTILIPFLDNDPKSLREYLQAQLAEDKDGDKGDFAVALDYDVSHIDARADVYRENITWVDIEGDDLRVAYEMHYSLYNGCKDMDVDDYVEYEVVGRRTADGWEFDEHEALPIRVPSDDI